MSIRKLVLAGAMLCVCSAAKADIIASEALRLDDLETVYFMLSNQEVHQRGRCLDIEGAKELVVNVASAGHSGSQYPGCYQHMKGGKIGVYFWEFDERDRVFMERDLSKFQKTKEFDGW